MELNGAVAVVTGASSGFGAFTATALARKGAHVVLAARRLERLELVVERTREQGGPAAIAVRCDVTELSDLRRLRDEVDRRHGRCDVLVNNAGIPGGGPFESLTHEQMDRVIRVNVLGVMHCTSTFLPMMLELERGHIVNVASLAGRFATPGASVYGASKHAVVAFSEALYYELGPRGVLVTAVNPGLAKTEGFPQRRMHPWLVMSPQRVADVIVDVVSNGRAPEVFVPRAAGAFQAFRVLMPPLYRWGVRALSRRLSASRAT